MDENNRDKPEDQKTPLPGCIAASVLWPFLLLIIFFRGYK